jgi:hypothetical protein
MVHKQHKDQIKWVGGGAVRRRFFSAERIFMATTSTMILRHWQQVGEVRNGVRTENRKWCIVTTYHTDSIIDCLFVINRKCKTLEIHDLACFDRVLRKSLFRAQSYSYGARLCTEQLSARALQSPHTTEFQQVMSQEKNVARSSQTMSERFHTGLVIKHQLEAIEE